MIAKFDPLRDPPPEASAGVAAAPAVLSRVGWLAAGSRPGALVVDYEGNSSGPLVARSVLALDEAAIVGALRLRQAVVLLFENGDVRLPIVVGLIAPDPGAALLGTLLTARPAAAPAPGGEPVVAAAPAPAPAVAPASVAPALEARVDGRRVIIEGQDEVVLKCGDAIITLRRDGKLILRGTYVETHAKGVNRIKGGSVKIN
jgi:hypothetical protein